MIRIVCRYYLKFPPIARKAINLSISSMMNGFNVDYYHSDIENVLIECDQVINQKLF